MASEKDLLGALVVVGITYREEDGSESRTQLAGIVESIDNDVITLRQATGSTFTLPPAPEAFQPAEPGAIYTLHSTGERIESPAFWAMFDVGAPS